MSIIIVTGSGGLIGSEASTFFHKQGFDVIGIDNNMRKYFFGAEGSTTWNIDKLYSTLINYKHYNLDIRDSEGINKLFKKYGKNIRCIIHTASQPSHDWAAKEPITDFTVNANGTLVLLESMKKYCPDSVFIFTSTNKVYGDSPNTLPLVETPTRWEIDKTHQYYNGIDETMSIDQSKHSLFGVSKTAADLMVQEYGRYFGVYTACFRGGCLAGPAHSGAPLHGFLSYLMKCAMTNTVYNILGYKGKQVRDNIHSYDLVNAFWHYYNNPRVGEVYNIGGGRFSNCSILEAISLCENITGKKLQHKYKETNRIGDHIWWITNNNKFKLQFPEWNLNYDVEKILIDIYDANIERWSGIGRAI